MKFLFPFFLFTILVSCSDDVQKSGGKTSSTATDGTQPSVSSSPSISPDSLARLDSLVRGFDTKAYNLIDTFSSTGKTRNFATAKKMIRTTYSFNTEKILYNTGVRSSAYTAVVAGFNTGSVQQKDAAMDGLVVRMIEKNGYWFLQANIASFYIHERWTVDVLFIASSEIEVIR